MLNFRRFVEDFNKELHYRYRPLPIKFRWYFNPFCGIYEVQIVLRTDHQYFMIERYFTSADLDRFKHPASEFLRGVFDGMVTQIVVAYCRHADHYDPHDP